MKHLRKGLVIGTIVTMLGVATITASAASAYSSPAEAAAGITGRSVDSVLQERKDTDKTYGTIAKEAGKLDEFKKEILEQKKDRLNERVESGTLTQEKADEIIAAIEENQANCDGTGAARIGRKMGAGFGSQNGDCQGTGKHDGNRKGNGRGQGFGRGMRNGSCIEE